jgi:hypothetical protein
VESYSLGAPVLRWPREPAPGTTVAARRPAADARAGDAVSLPVDPATLPIDPSTLLVVGAGTAMAGYLFAVWGLGLVAGFPWALRLARRTERGTQDEVVARVGAQTTGLALLGLGLALLSIGVCSGGALFLLLERLSQ